MLKKKLKSNLTLGNKKKLASRKPIEDDEELDEDEQEAVASEDEDEDEDEEEERPKKKLGKVLGVKKKASVVEDEEDEEDEEAEDSDEDDDDDEDEAPKKKGRVLGLPKKKASARDEDEDEDEDDDDGDDDDEGEVPAKKKKVLAKGKVKVKGKKSSASPLSAAWDSVPLTNNADDIPQGKYEAIIKSFVLQDPDGKGQSARVNFELCSPDFAENNQITQWFKLVDGDGEKVEGGVRALKSALAKLGYEPEADELEECFETLTEEKPGVLIKVSYSKDSDGNTWQRANIQGECDNDVVQEYKDNVQY